MNRNTFLSLILKILTFTLLLSGLTVIVIDSIGVSFVSEKARDVLHEQLKALSNRDVHIDGDVKVTISLVPKLVVDRIHIRNLEGFGDEDFITVSEARVEVSLLPLLAGNIQLHELAASHAHVSLVKKEDGSYNWSFKRMIKIDDAAIETIKKSSDKNSTTKKLSLAMFRLTDISIKYADKSDDKVIENHLDHLIIDLNNISKPYAEISGVVQGSAYDLTFESDSLQSLITGEAWELNGTGKIADRNLTFNSIFQVDNNLIEGNVVVNVKDINLGLLLERLGVIAGQDAISEELNIDIKMKGEDATELYQKAGIKLNFSKGHFRFAPVNAEIKRDIIFNDISITTSWDEPVDIELDGSIAGEETNVSVSMNRLREFFNDVDKLDVNLEAQVTGSKFTVSGSLDMPVKKRQFQLDMSIKGKNMEELNKILDIELPPFNHYSMTGKISANEKGFIIKAEDATIGDTHFKTAIVIDLSSFKPFWTIKLKSRELQIKDLEFTTLGVETLGSEGIQAAFKKKDRESRKKPGRSLKDIVENPKMHLDLSLIAEKVLMGNSVLGSTSLDLKLRDNTLILHDAELDVPGGKVKSTIAFKVENEQVNGSIKLDMDKFESGIIVRYFTQEKKQGGVISARVDLKLGGKNFSRLLDHATGKIDMVMWPRNFQTNIFNIWATNLFLIILPEVNKRESRINCFVALMDLDDGIMKEDFFAVDTTKVWMNGNIKVNFVDEYVQLSLYPRSKKAKVFAWQAPIRAEGKFSEIDLSTNPVDLTISAIAFVTSPLHVPARLIFTDKIPEDASAACEQLYDREYVKNLKEKAEKAEQKDIDEFMISD